MYLLDANVLIQAKNQYYPFDVVPGFWDWIEQSFRSANTYSVHQVLVELNRGNDDLTAWANNQPAAFFAKPDGMTQQSMITLARWVSQSPYTATAQRDFLGGADYYLVAHAHAHGYAVVTHEASQPNSRKRILIPDVCHAFNIRSLRTWDWLRDERVILIVKT